MDSIATATSDHGMPSTIGQTEGNGIRLLLLDAHGLFRTSLARFLASETGFEIAGECATPTDALEILSRSPVDLILLDSDVDNVNAGNEFISAVRQAGYQGRFLFLLDAPDARNSALALKGGASGVFLKSDAPDRLVQAIRLVEDGGIWVDQKVIQLLADGFADRSVPLDDREIGAILEVRERNVLLGILGGLTNKKIGANMGLSESSVKNIVQRLFTKAGVKTRSQLVRVPLEGSLGMTRRLISKQYNKNRDRTSLSIHSGQGD